SKSMIAAMAEPSTRMFADRKSRWIRCGASSKAGAASTRLRSVAAASGASRSPPRPSHAAIRSFRSAPSAEETVRSRRPLRCLSGGGTSLSSPRRLWRSARARPAASTAARSLVSNRCPETPGSTARDSRHRGPATTTRTAPSRLGTGDATGAPASARRERTVVVAWRRSKRLASIDHLMTRGPCPALVAQAMALWSLMTRRSHSPMSSPHTSARVSASHARTRARSRQPTRSASARPGSWVSQSMDRPSGSMATLYAHRRMCPGMSRRHVCSVVEPVNQCCKLLAVTLLTARDIREIAADIGLRPTKQKGQNFVIDPNTVRSIVTAAGLEDAANVVEIGPGLGSLTLGLLEAGHSVTAVEIDELLAARLPQTVERFAGTEATDREPATGTEAAGTEAAGTEAADRADRTARFSLVGADALKVTELPAPVSGGEAN